MRIIDEKHRPSNIRTFHAASLLEAIQKTSSLIREPGVQGTVWLRDEFAQAASAYSSSLQNLAPQLEEEVCEGTLLKHVPENPQEKKGFFKKIKDSLSSPFYATPVYKTPTGRFVSENFLVYFELKRHNDLGTLITQDLGDVVDALGSVTVKVRFAKKPSKIIPHVDVYREENPQGFYMRGIETLDRDTTLVYDFAEINPDILPRLKILKEEGAPKDEIEFIQATEMPEPWKLRLYDWLFIVNAVDGIEIALPHSEPDFELIEGDMRITRSINFVLPEQSIWPS